MINPILLPVGELKTALTGLHKIINKSAALPVLGCVRIRQHPQGPQIQATNLDDYAQYQMPGSNGSTDPGEVVVPFDALNRLVKICSPDETIGIIPKPDNQATIAYQAGNRLVEQSIEAFPVSDWPAPPIINGQPAVLDGKFQATLKAALDCCSDNDSRPMLQGALVDVSNPNAHYVVATDGKHLLAANSFHFDLAQSLLIPNRKFITWAGFLDDGEWRLSAQQVMEINWVKIQSQHWTCITRQIEGSYPNWRQVMPPPEGFKTTITLNEAAVKLLREALPKLPGGQEDNQAVTLLVEGSELWVLARSKSCSAWTRIPVTGATVKGESTRVTINRGYAVKALKIGLTEIAIQDSCSALVFTGNGQKMVVMPIRMEGSDDAAVENTASPASETKPSEPPPAKEPTPQPQPQPQPEEIKTMIATQTTTHPTAPTVNEGNTPPLKTALQQLEAIRDSLRIVTGGLNDLVKTLAQAQRDKRNTEKEIESIRDSLRSLQKVRI